jgi:transcription initiation factor TFIIH subunit 1
MRTCRARCRLFSHLLSLFCLISQSQLSEAEFWKRYFQSKLFHSHRASIRSTATQHVVKDDAIFDKYLEKPDDGELPLFSPGGSCQHNILELEPRKPRDDEVDMFIDLEATRGDHEEVRNLTFRGPFHTCVNFTMIL